MLLMLIIVIINVIIVVIIIIIVIVETVCCTGIHSTSRGGSLRSSKPQQVHGHGQRCLHR